MSVELDEKLAELAERDYLVSMVKGGNLSTLPYAGNKILGDREFIKQIVEIDAEALEYATDELKEDKAFLLDLVEVNASVVGALPEELRADFEFMFQCAIRNENATFYMAEEMTDKINDNWFKMQELGRKEKLSEVYDASRYIRDSFKYFGAKKDAKCFKLAHAFEELHGEDFYAQTKRLVGAYIEENNVRDEDEFKMDVYDLIDELE